MFAAVLLIVFGAIGLIVLGSILRGWALSILWGWFIVPFFGLPPLSIPYAIGIALVVTYVTGHPDNIKEEYKEGTGKTLAITILQPFVVLLVGWIITKFI